MHLLIYLVFEICPPVDTKQESGGVTKPAQINQNTHLTMNCPEEWVGGGKDICSNRTNMTLEEEIEIALLTPLKARL